MESNQAPEVITLYAALARVGLEDLANDEQAGFLVGWEGHPKMFEQGYTVTKGFGPTKREAGLGDSDERIDQRTARHSTLWCGGEVLFGWHLYEPGTHRRLYKAAYVTIRTPPGYRYPVLVLAISA